MLLQMSNRQFNIMPCQIKNLNLDKQRVEYQSNKEHTQRKYEVEYILIVENPT